MCIRDSNIIEPYESWEFISDDYVEVPQDGKETHTAWVYYKSEEGFDNELKGWWYQKIYFGPIPGRGELPQLNLLQYPLVEVE